MSKLFNSVWFKCIAVLLLIATILGGTLAVLNDVLYVSPEERTLRAVKKIYGVEKNYSVILDEDVGDPAILYDFGCINKIYQVESDGASSDLLFKSTGYNGYKGGTITLWIKVVSSDNKLIIDKVVLDGYTKQTLMSKLTGSYYDAYLVDVTDAYRNGQNFTTQNGAGDFSNPVSGATYSANAGNNAVNCIIAYLGGAQ